MSTTTQAFIGKGSIYLEEIGGNMGLLPFGNCPELTLAFAEDKKEMTDSEGAGGGIVASVSRISGVTGSISALSISKENIALALRGLISTESVTAVTDEAKVVYQGAFVEFDKVPDPSTIVVKDETDTTTYVAGTDYEIKSSGIVILATGNITSGDSVKLSYTPIGAVVVESLATSAKEYRMVFDGLNEADSGNPVELTCHKVKFSPAQALSLISDDFATLPLSFDILKDESVAGSTKSKFARIRMVK